MIFTLGNLLDFGDQGSFSNQTKTYNGKKKTQHQTFALKLLKETKI